MSSFTINPRVILCSLIFTKLAFDRICNLASLVNPSADPQAPILDVFEYSHPSSGDEIYKMISSYGPKGRQAYLSLSLFDTGFVLIRVIPLCVFAQWAYSKYPRIANPLIYFFAVASVWEVLENAMVWFVVKQFPRRYDGIASLLVYWISIKWFTLYVTVASLALGVLVGIYYSFHALLADSVLMDKDRTNPKPVVKRPVAAGGSAQRSKKAD
ncbi:hypothetical protein INT44_004028 [Umbelopsis vinacea]|uniref:Uncharacterized protein n=1 Tax=Umbelopsis vinacea TaxID=44442 RepID=A0A8H7UR18_9FUNG|nr:hypothetical protein INT44_004028 [Umbelopsis vinacea]